MAQSKNLIRISVNWSSLASPQPGHQRGQQVKPDDHSEVVPLLPIPNRTVKRLCANDSAGSRVKVGHRQAINARDARFWLGVFFSKECDRRIRLQSLANANKNYGSAL